MTTRKPRIAILFPADRTMMLATSLEQSRFVETAAALRAAGLDVVGAPFADEIVDDTRRLLSEVQGVLAWFNPIEGGRDRTKLNAMLLDIASKGVFVSAHPDVIDRIGTKEVLHRTRNMGWGCDTRLYADVDEMRSELPASLRSGAPRVLKQIRGQSGDGVWKVALAESQSTTESRSTGPVLRVQHAKRGAPEELVALDEFLARCRGYFTTSGCMIDQAYQPRLAEGMVRCYLVRDRVAGFGEQLVNMLYPSPVGSPASEAPLPGPRLYYPPTRADFQRLKNQLERHWVDELCQIVGLAKSQLPVLWDADFLYGPKDADGADTYVLCEINVSSVYPFPPTAMAPLVAETLARIQINSSHATCING
jgi:hypothetical protein